MERYLTTSIRQAIRRAAFGAAVLSAMALAPAYATPLVTSWNYTASTTFADATARNGNAIVPSQNGTVLCWGDAQGSGNPAAPCGNNPSKGNGQSALQIKPSTASAPPGTPATTFEGSGLPPQSFYQNIFTLTHFNNPINNYQTLSLRHTDIDPQLTLTPTGGGAPFTINATFGIDFDETSNTALPCTVAPTNPDNPCPDIFVIDPNAQNRSFAYDGNNYFLSFFALGPNGEPLGSLSPAACMAAGIASGVCDGFVTQENQSNPFNMGFAISSQPIGVPVPEPGELGLMGLGGLLLGFGVYWRRREGRKA